MNRYSLSFYYKRCESADSPETEHQESTAEGKVEPAITYEQHYGETKPKHQRGQDSGERLLENPVGEGPI